MRLIQDRQCTYNVTLRRVRATIVTVEKQRVLHKLSVCTGRFIMFSVISNIYNKKTKGPTLMEFFTATRKLKMFFFFFTTKDVRCVHHG